MRTFGIALAVYAAGIVSALGLVAASQSYEYKMSWQPGEMRQLVERDGWQPMQAGADSTLYLRRPRLRLP